AGSDNKDERRIRLDLEQRPPNRPLIRQQHTVSRIEHKRFQPETVIKQPVDNNLAESPVCIVVRNHQKLSATKRFKPGRDLTQYIAADNQPAYVNGMSSSAPAFKRHPRHIFDPCFQDIIHSLTSFSTDSSPIL